MEVRELTWDELPRFSTGLCLSVQRVGDPLLLQRERGACLGPAGSTCALWKKFMLGTLPDFYLSKSALENWLKVLCTGGWLLVIWGRGGRVCFLVWVLTANRLKLGSKPF